MHDSYPKNIAPNLILEIEHRYDPMLQVIFLRLCTLFSAAFAPLKNILFVWEKNCILDENDIFSIKKNKIIP